MKTKVFITIDTEFSIGGAFNDPAKYSPVGEQAVYCKIGDRSHGLGFLLDTFKEFSTPATFFIEVLNRYFFDDQPMRDIALQIKAAGQDLQMHLHPCWTYFKNPDWMDNLKQNPPSDHMNQRSHQQLCEWINDGLEIFARWGLDRPVAMRTGSLMTDAAVYIAMEASGIRVASNVGVGLFQPKEPELNLYSGLHKVGNVLEAPVLTYIERQCGKHVKHRLLTVTGASSTETRALLLKAYNSGVDAVVILTHPFEYIKCSYLGYSTMFVNKINQQRLKNLCAFLAENNDKFEAATFGQLEDFSLATDSTPNVLLKAPLLPVVGRMVENVVNDNLMFI